MKKTLLFAAAACMFAAPVFAQAPQAVVAEEVVECQAGPGQAPCCMMMEQFEGLGLTDAQTQALKKLNENTAPAGRNGQDRKKIRNERRDSIRAERQQAMKAQRSGYLAEIKKILTPEQYVQFLENYYTTTPTAPQKNFRPGAQRQPKAMKHRGGQRGREASRQTMAPVERQVRR